MNMNTNSSLLSVPYPNEGCNGARKKHRPNTNQNKNHDPYRKKDGSYLNYETEIITEEMKKLGVAERNKYERAVQGHSIISTTILERGSSERSSSWESDSNITQSTPKFDGLAEDSAFLNIKFQELEGHLLYLLNKSNTDEAYQLARSQNLDYVQDPHFKIGFLRAERYDAAKAAQRMIRHFREKLELFGEDKLAQDICWEDLGEDGQWYHKHAGGLHILPKRDQAGRQVLFMADVIHGLGLESQATRLGIRKACFYFMMTLGEPNNEQDNGYHIELGRVKGIVIILWRLHRPPSPNLEDVQASCRIRDLVPVKISAYHFCHPPIHLNLKTLNEFSKLILPAIQTRGIIKYYRSHYKETVACMYELWSEYGIPIHVFPLTQEHDGGRGDATTKAYRPFHDHYVKAWIDYRIRKEAEKKLMHYRRSRPLMPDFKDLFDDHSDDGNSSMGTIGWDDSLLEPEETNRSNVEPTPAERGKANNISAETNDAGGVSTRHNTITIVRPEDIRPEDILVGNNPDLRYRLGNKHFREVVANQYENYRSREKEEKTELSTEIVANLILEGRRFLRQHKASGTWRVADEKEARDKVSNTFRGIKKQEDRKLSRNSRTAQSNADRI